MNHKYAIEYEGVNGKREFANTDKLIINGTPFEENDDAVSRQAVLTIFDEWFSTCDIADKRESPKAKINALPLVTPKPKTGKWVFLHDTFSEWDGVTWHFKCSECGRRVTLGTFKMMARPTDNEDWERLLETYPYCHCGAKMEGEGVNE